MCLAGRAVLGPSLRTHTCSEASEHIGEISIRLANLHGLPLDADVREVSRGKHAVPGLQGMRCILCGQRACLMKVTP